MAGYGRDDSVTGHTYELLYPDTRSLHSGMRISMEQVKKQTEPSPTISEHRNSQIIDGMAFGFLSYLIVKVARAKFKDIKPLMYVICALFIVMYVIYGLQAMGILKS